jgi:hypothetical protein
MIGMRYYACIGLICPNMPDMNTRSAMDTPPDMKRHPIAQISMQMQQNHCQIDKKLGYRNKENNISMQIMATNRPNSLNACVWGYFSIYA